MIARLAAAALAFATGCGEPEPVRIAVVVGENAMEGARAAAEGVNASGGIGGRRLELVELGEWATDAAPAIQGAERLAADPTVLAVVGHASSASTLAASQVYNAHGLVQVAPTSTATLLSSAGPYSFRLVPADAKQAAFLAAAANRVAAPRTAAILYDNDDYGRGLHDELSRELAARGVRVAASVPYVLRAGSESMHRLPQRLAEQRPEVVFWLGRQAWLAEFLAALRSVLPAVPVLASDGVDVPALYANPGDFAGLWFVRFVDPSSGRPCVQRLRDRSAPGTGGRAEDVLTHDAVLVLAEVMRAGARTRSGIRDRLAALGTSAPAVEGCAGPVRFDAAGDVERPYLLGRVGEQGVFPVHGDHR